MLAAAVAVAVGIVVGSVVTLVVVRRSATQSAPASISDAAPAAEAIGSGLAQVDSLHREAVDHLEIGVVVASPDGTVRYRNSAAAAFVGTHVGVLLDDHIRVVIAGALAGDATSRLAEMHGPPKVWLDIAGTPLPSGGVVVTVRDVSERVRTDAMRSDFVTNISHELKTPVGAIAVLAEALIEETDLSVVQRLGSHLVDEAHRAVRTIDDLLKLSEIESTSAGSEIVDLRAVMRAAVGRGRAVDNGRGVEITTADGPEQLLVRGDERQLLSAVGNLVENAVKYSHSGDVVQIMTRVDDEVVEVMVADQGVGIPARDLDRVFERFYRIDKARSRETGGTGLGLAIVRHVATNHGGAVLVSSREGEGSTFVLRLPASLMVTADEPTDVDLEHAHHE